MRATLALNGLNGHFTSSLFRQTKFNNGRVEFLTAHLKWRAGVSFLPILSVPANRRFAYNLLKNLLRRTVQSAVGNYLEIFSANLSCTPWKQISLMKQFQNISLLRKLDPCSNKDRFQKDKMIYCLVLEGIEKKNVTNSIIDYWTKWELVNNYDREATFWTLSRQHLLMNFPKKLFTIKNRT